jgi:hypothetical protein
VPLLYIELLKKNQNLNFWYFKVPQANYFWADFAALALVESMPKFQLKSLKSHNF